VIFHIQERLFIKQQTFDYELFYNWALTNNNPVFISEYAMPNDFIEIASFKHRSTLSAICKQ
jgi:hypothetical protein